MVDYTARLDAFDIFGKAWKLTLAHFWKFLAILAIVTVLEIVFQNIGALTRNFAVEVAIPILFGIFVSTPLRFGVAWTFLQGVRQKPFKITDIFNVFDNNYWQIILASLLMMVLVFLGLLVFVLPGIYIGIRLSMMMYLVVDKKIKAVDAMKQSWHMTKGHVLLLLGVWLLSIAVFVAGALVLLVGMIFAFVWMTAAYSVLYHSLDTQNKPVRKVVRKTKKATSPA